MRIFRIDDLRNDALWGKTAQEIKEKVKYLSSKNGFNIGQVRYLKQLMSYDEMIFMLSQRVPQQVKCFEY